MTDLLFEIEGLDFAYPRGSPVLSGIDLNIRVGEFLTLLGASGCGKSTLLRLVAGLLESHDASVWQEEGGNTLSKAVVFQDPTLLPWATVFENVALPLKIAGLDRHQRVRRVTEALKLVGLDADQHKRPAALSGGMRMRVSLARALVSEPQLLLMDEPFAALDEITRNRLNDDVRTLAKKQNMAVLFITHNVTEAVFMSDRICIMQAGPGPIAHTITFENQNFARSDPKFHASVAEVSSTLSEIIGR